MGTAVGEFVCLGKWEISASQYSVHQLQLGRKYEQISVIGKESFSGQQHLLPWSFFPLRAVQALPLPDWDKVWRVRGPRNRGVADLIFTPAFRICCICIELHGNYSDQDYAGYKKAEYAFSFAPPRPCPCIPPPTAYFHMPTPVSPWLWSIALFPAFMCQ